MNFINMIKLKKMIIISAIIVILIIIIMLLLVLNVKNTEIREEEEILDKGNITPDISYEKVAVTNHSMFFSVEGAIQNYLNAIALDTKKITAIPVEGSSMRNAETIYAENHNITNEESKNEVIYNFLEENYILQNNITKENILQKIENEGDVKFQALQMLQVEGKNIVQFAVYGREIKEQTKFKEVYFVVNVDNKNNTFCIKPIEKTQYGTIEEIPLDAKDESIKNKQSNYFNFQTLQNMDITQKYFTYYKNLMLIDTAKAYELLDEEYRNKRFGSMEEFQKYIDSNRKDIETYVAKEYSTKNIDDNVEYICMDKYQHQYLFNVSSVMNFTVKLDTYTIEDEEVREKYEKAKDNKKVQMNVDKWIMMLNNRDYKAAYDALDETFRNDNFQSVDKFEQYMRSAFPLYYGLNFSDINEESGLFIQDILLTDITSNEKIVIPETIIMKLTDDGFRMSFRILNH